MEVNEVDDVNDILKQSIKEFDKMCPGLNIAKKLNSMFLNNNAPDSRSLFNDYTANDAKKDSKNKQNYKTPIENIWGVSPSDLYSNNSDATKMLLIKSLLNSNFLRTDTYTRSPGTNKTTFVEFSPNFIIHDCGPNYSGKDDEKSIKNPSGAPAGYLTTTAQIIDSAPSKSKTVSNHLNKREDKTYNLDSIGFPRTELCLYANNNNFQIKYKTKIGDEQIIDQSNITDWNIGNKKIAFEMEKSSISDAEKETYIIVKGVGDALKSFFTHEYASQYNRVTFALLTCDINLFIRALMLLRNQDNAYILFSSILKGGSTGSNKTAMVYMKSSEPDYSQLCKELIKKIETTSASYINILQELIIEEKFQVHGDSYIYFNQDEFLEKYVDAIKRNLVLVDKFRGVEKENYFNLRSCIVIKLFTLDNHIKPTVTHISVATKSNILRFNKLRLKRVRGGGLHLPSNLGGGLSYFTDEPLTLGDDWLQIYYLVYNIYFEILTKTELKMFRSIGMAPNYDLKDETRVKKTEIEPFIQENTLYELLTYYFEAYHDYTDEAIRKYINELIPLYTPTSIATGNKIRTRPRPATKRSIKNSTRRATRAPIRRATRRAPNRLRRPPTRRAPNRLTRLQHLRDIKKDTYNPTYISNKRYRPLNKSIFLNI